MFGKILSKICVYSIIPTLATFSDTHADWMLVSVFHGQHGDFCSENGADLLWNYFSDSVFRASLKRPSRTSRSSASMSSFPRKMIAFYNQNNSHTDYVVSRPPSHITCMSVIAYCSTWPDFTYRMHIQCFIAPIAGRLRSFLLFRVLICSQEQSNSTTTPPRRIWAVVDSMFYFIMNRSRNSSWYVWNSFVNSSRISP